MFWVSSCTFYRFLSKRYVLRGEPQAGFFGEHPLVCGLFYGIAVELVMIYFVLPLSALHARGPHELHDVILGLLVHMVVVGLPISFSVRRSAK
jgi:hypothetical protein